MSFRFFSSSLITTIGITTSCSAKRNRALGSERSTEVSKTKVLTEVSGFFAEVGLLTSWAAVFFADDLDFGELATCAPAC